MATHTQTIPFRLSPARLIMWGLAVLGGAVAIVRFWHGIGAVSNLNDAYPWGLWISLDLLCGVALAAGAFTTCAAVYVLGMEQFRPLVRPAVLTGFLGYIMVVVALLVDLGRPERIWHMIIYWNPHSPLFEVGICVMTYLTVLLLEFSPLALEPLGWKKPLALIHKITLPLVIAGVLLSTLHQSSLGSLYLVNRDRLNALWHSPLLPIFFFLSAAAVGPAMVTLEASIAGRVYGHKHTDLLSRLTAVLPWLLGLYLALKFGELAYAGEFGLLFRGGMAPLWWGEMAIFATAAVMLAIPRIRRHPTGVLTGAVLVIVGLMFNRFNVGLIAWNRPGAPGYTPHWMEFAVSIGVISAGVLAYDWVARNLKLFVEDGHH